LRTKLGKVGRRSGGDAITQMILGIFARDVPESKAREALDRLRALVVDYNELRVVPPIEMAEMVGTLPNARLKCEDLSRALNRVFALEHEISLGGLRALSSKEAREYLASIDGLDAYSRARVQLLGLEHHAIPLDEAMWAYARRERIVDRKCSLEEAQGFLERRIPEGEALEFVALLEKQAWAEMGAAVRNRDVEQIASVPPDRTARNMLQLVASGRSTLVPAPEPEKAKEVAAAAKPADRAKKPAQPKSSTKAAKKPKLVAGQPKPKTKKAARKSKPKPKAALRPRGKSKAKTSQRAKRRTAARNRSKAKALARKRPAKRTRRPVRKAKSA
jgi:hypothetical protein